MTEQSAEAILSQLNDIYTEAVRALRSAIEAFVAHGTKPDPDARANGIFAYPELRLTYHGEDGPALPPPLRSFGRLTAPGRYATTVTRPEIFRDYLIEQLDLLINDYGVTIEVGRSRQETPFPYVLDPGHEIALEGVAPTELARWFPATASMRGSTTSPNCMA